MTDFNMWTWNCRVFPGIDPLAGAARRPRAHPHRQSHHDQPPDPSARPQFRGDLHRRRLGAGERALAGGDDRRRRSAPMRAFEFVADEPGDWAIHCHKSHHTMNAMGHDVKTFIGVDKQDLAESRSASSCPDYMAMGATRHGRDGRDGNAAARQHAADDDRLRAVRPDRDGRHVLGREGARGACARRLQGPRPVQASRRATVAPDSPGDAPRRALDSRRAQPDNRVSVVKPGRHQEPLAQEKQKHDKSLARRSPPHLAPHGCAPAAYAHGDDNISRPGEPGNPRKSRAVEMVMTEGDGAMVFAPDKSRVKRGEADQVRLEKRRRAQARIHAGEHARKMPSTPS